MIQCSWSLPEHHKDLSVISEQLLSNPTHIRKEKVFVQSVGGVGHGLAEMGAVRRRLKLLTNAIYFDSVDAFPSPTLPSSPRKRGSKGHAFVGGRCEKVLVLSWRKGTNAPIV